MYARRLVVQLRGADHYFLILFFFVELIDRMRDSLFLSTHSLLFVVVGTTRMIILSFFPGFVVGRESYQALIPVSVTPLRLLVC